jgi:uncharacterized protein (DUF58 family)
MAVLATLIGLEELYAVAVACLAVLAVSAAWLWHHELDLAASSWVAPRRAGTGDNAFAHLGLANLADRRVPVVVVTVPLDRLGRLDGPGAEAGVMQASRAPAHVASFCVPGLGPRAETSARYRLPTTQRGAWVLGPVIATLSDPLGLLERTWAGGPEVYFAVHPPVRRLAPPDALPGPDRSGSGPLHLPVPGGDELHALREYQTGDDMRRVHWRSTAHWGRLMVRQDEVPRPRTVIVGLDLRDHTHSAESLERCMEAAASIVSAMAGQPSTEVCFTTTAGDRAGPGSGDHLVADVLDRLAVSGTHGQDLGSRLFYGRPDVAVLISPTEHAAEQLLRSTGVAAPTIVAVAACEAPANGQSPVTFPSWGLGGSGLGGSGLGGSGLGGSGLGGSGLGGSGLGGSGLGGSGLGGSGTSPGAVIVLKSGGGLGAAWAQAFGR